MIVFKLRCENAHEFEGWFKNSASFEEQKKSSLVACPICASTSTVKVLASNISVKKGAIGPKCEGKDLPKFQFALLRKISEHVRREFENVGSRFAEEAKKIFYRETPAKNIYGTTTEKEEKQLKEEGVEFFKFPILKDHDD